MCSVALCRVLLDCIVSFFFNDTSTTEIYTYCHTLSLHDALPICRIGDSYIHGFGAIGRSLGPLPFHQFWLKLHLAGRAGPIGDRSEEHTSELQSLMRISYAVFCLKKKKPSTNPTIYTI